MVTMKKILLVEDDVYIRDVTATRLMEHSFEVLTAATGGDALVLAEESLPDMVLVDLDLPDMPGLDVVIAMRKQERTARIPVIVFTNNNSPELAKKAVELGAQDFFTKATTDFEQMLEVIKRNFTI